VTNERSDHEIRFCTTIYIFVYRNAVTYFVVIDAKFFFNYYSVLPEKYEEIYG